MPIYDLLCKECKHEVIDVMLKIDEPLGNCPKCENPLVKICGCTSFKLLYNNKTDMCGWADSGYDRSQYWDAYKAARARGENVKPAGED